MARCSSLDFIPDDSSSPIADTRPEEIPDIDSLDDGEAAGMDDSGAAGTGAGLESGDSDDMGEIFPPQTVQAFPDITAQARKDRAATGKPGPGEIPPGVRRDALGRMTSDRPKISRPPPQWTAEDWEDDTGAGEPIPKISRRRQANIQHSIRLFIHGKRDGVRPYTVTAAAKAGRCSESALMGIVKADHLRAFKLEFERRKRMASGDRDSGEAIHETTRRAGMLLSLQNQHTSIIQSIAALPAASPMIAKLLTTEKALRQAIDALLRPVSSGKSASKAPSGKPALPDTVADTLPWDD